MVVQGGSILTPGRKRCAILAMFGSIAQDGVEGSHSVYIVDYGVLIWAMFFIADVHPQTLDQLYMSYRRLREILPLLSHADSQSNRGHATAKRGSRQFVRGISCPFWTFYLTPALPRAKMVESSLVSS